MRNEVKRAYPASQAFEAPGDLLVELGLGVLLSPGLDADGINVFDEYRGAGLVRATAVGFREKDDSAEGARTDVVSDHFYPYVD
jgi:hypothetical protein